MIESEVHDQIITSSHNRTSIIWNPYQDAALQVESSGFHQNLLSLIPYSRQFHLFSSVCFQTLVLPAESSWFHQNLLSPFPCSRQFHLILRCRLSLFETTFSSNTCMQAFPVHCSKTFSFSQADNIMETNDDDSILLWSHNTISTPRHSLTRVK